MRIAILIFEQTVVMFLYMFAGYLLFRGEKITVKGSRDMANLLLWLVIPSVLVDSFCVERTAAKMIELLQSALAGALALLIAMAIAAVIFRKDPIDNFGSAFSNAGFIGIPLVREALGDDAVFWIVGIIAMLNMLQWTYGVRVMTGKKSSKGIKGILANPLLVGICIGLLLFLTGLGAKLPDVLRTTLDGISAINAPLAMIVLGTYLAQANALQMLTERHLYLVSLVRLIIIPLATLFVFCILPVPREILLAVFISASAPIGSNVAVYAQLNDQDYPYACQTVALTTLLSIITLPVMMMLAGRML